MGSELLPFMTPELGNLIAGFFTLAIASLLYKENPVYRFAEHAYLGTSISHVMLTTWNNNLKPRLTDDLIGKGQYWMLIPLAMGLLIYFNLNRASKYSWLVRIPMSFWIGWGAARQLSVRTVNPFFVQIVDNMRPLIVLRNESFSLGGSLTNIIFVVSVLTTMVVFFFTYELKGIFVPMAKIGRYSIMLGLGASFGNTVGSRYSMLIGRFEFLLRDWLHLL